MKEVVKYNNRMNLLNFKGMTQVENNLFFALLSKLKNKGTQELELNIADLLIYDRQNLTNKKAAKLMLKASEKVIQSAIKWEIEPGRTSLFNLFERFDIYHNDFKMVVKITETFKEILNNFENGGFTVFELSEFSSLTSKYTQTIYRLLKQFRGTGFFVMEWNDFREKLDIPKSYNMGTIEHQILKPSLKDLSEPNLFFTEPIFKNLKYEKQKTKGKGNKITHISFTFTPENTDNKQIRATKKERAELKKKQENQDFKNQFYNKKVKDNKGVVYNIYTIEKIADNKIKAMAEFYTTGIGLQQHTLIFDNIEQIKKAVEKYEKENPIKDRPEVRAMFS